jgi:hypothetical protein
VAWLGWALAVGFAAQAAVWRLELVRARRRVQALGKLLRARAVERARAAGIPPPLPRPLTVEFPRHALMRRLTGVLPRFRLPDDD